ncbi:MAG: hypothetical protein K2Q45_09045 [Nitrosomonas sp.]|nr:hypothetical protein [Nitrosomonas sp.]
MGVDFEECDTCGDITCDQNITHVELERYGEFNICTVCMKAYFTKEWTVEDQRHILSEEEHGYTFFVADTTGVPEDYEFTKKDAIFISESFYEIEDFAKDKTNLIFGMIETREKDKREDWFYYDESDGWEVLLLELFDTFEADQKKLDRDLEDDYDMTFVPNEKWKKLMQKKLDEQIEYLKIKRQKFSN